MEEELDDDVIVELVLAFDDDEDGSINQDDPEDVW